MPPAEDLTRYSLVMADPPWAYRNGGNGAARNHYQTMTPAQLQALPVSRLAAPDAILILWATWPQLEVAMNLFPAWGFSYVTGFPWLKLAEGSWSDVLTADLFGQPPSLTPAYGTGAWARGCSEPILIGRRGKAKPLTGSWLGIIGERLQHSRKPDSIYQYAETVSAGPYLELFARRPRPRWAVWGNEAEGSIDMTRYEDLLD